MKRLAMQELIVWKNSPTRLPMLITGPRQCGKTYLMEEFGNTYFAEVKSFNFEKNPELAELFAFNYDVDRILSELGMYSGGKAIDTEQTLLIFDEIQQCPKAITALKYFAESKRNLYILCAGSLLGVEIKRKGISFPVGKIQRLSLYPMSFTEFIIALGEEDKLTSLRNWDLYRAIPSFLHETMQKYLNLYYIIGGMPAAVKKYIETQDFSEVDKVLDGILRDYRDDFSNHAEAKDIVRIGYVWDSVPKQLAKENQKFVFSHVKEGSRARDLEDSLRWLVDAGLVYCLEKVGTPNMPLSAYADATYFKTYCSDVGLLRKKAGVSYRAILTNAESISSFMGAFTENYCMTELINAGYHPYFWRNDATAEVDFLIESDELVIPVEAKAAENTKAKSFSSYCKTYSPKIGFRLSRRNVGDNQKKSVHEIALPLYLVWKLNRYILDNSQPLS